MLVSIVIPTFNRVDKILGAVESALGQTYRDIEVIVVDDGSTDGTDRALGAFSGAIGLIRQDNAGPSAARNRGAALAKGKILAFLDSDDSWAPEKIARQVELMRRGGTGMCCCVCNATVIGTGGETVGNTFELAAMGISFEEGEWTNPQDVLATRFLLFNQVVAVRREAFERVGGFNPRLRLLEDYELSLRLATAGTWGVIREPLVFKYNDTNGIGVECMMNRERHAQVQADVISGLLRSQNELGALARLNLERALRDLKLELRALAMLKQNGAMVRAGGRFLKFLARGRRSMRQRSPSWPRFEGRALDVGQPD